MRWLSGAICGAIALALWFGTAHWVGVVFVASIAGTALWDAAVKEAQ
jgi:predicted exporter